MKIGIMAAMPEEVHTIHTEIQFHNIEQSAERSYFSGKQDKLELTLVCSRCGKVSAAATTVSLIEKYGVEFIIFTGVAGSVHPSIKIGDIVLAENTYQHDMDARPIFPRFEVPLTSRSLFSSQPEDLERGSMAIQNFIKHIDHYVSRETLKIFDIEEPRLYRGTIATGDQFIQDPAHHDGLKLNENVFAVEMEGAAVAQVCAEYKIPYLLIRTISDGADHNAAVNFQAFLTEVASHYSSGIIQEFLKIILAQMNRKYLKHRKRSVITQPY